MRKFCKILSLVLVFALLVSLVACSGSSQSTDDGTYRVAMITDGGEITDQSFNQATYEACKKYCKENNLKMTYKKPENKFTDSLVAMIDSAIMEGYNIIVCCGYVFAEPLINVTNLYPDVKFIALDVSKGDILSAALGTEYDNNPDNWDASQYYNSKNTYCAVYREEQAGFEAGYAAVKLGFKKLGFLGGMPMSPVVRYGYGFVQGVDYAAKELGISDKVEVEYAYGGEFYGSTEITAAMSTWYQNGTEVVFSCGGGIYTSACEAAAKYGGKIIGVDVDQAETIDTTYGEGMTITSAMKNLDQTVEVLLDSITIDNTWSDYAGQFGNLGIVSKTNADENFVKISDSTQFNSSFTKKDYQDLIAKIYDEKISISSSVEEKPNVSVSVNYREGTIM